MLTEILICLKRKKPAAFYFLRSAAPHYRHFAPLRFAKVAAGWRVRERPFLRLLFSGKVINWDVNYEFIKYRKKDKKKPAAFYFLRSAAPHYRRFATPTAPQKSRRVGESWDVHACAALWRERIDISNRKDFKQKKASNFLLSRQRAVSSA